jgi:hypothetical protein
LFALAWLLPQVINVLKKGLSIAYSSPVTQVQYDLTGAGGAVKVTLANGTSFSAKTVSSDGPCGWSLSITQHSLTAAFAAAHQEGFAFCTQEDSRVGSSMAPLSSACPAPTSPCTCTLSNTLQAIITVPLGVLQKGSIAFTPALPASKQTAINRLGMGLLDKVGRLNSMVHCCVLNSNKTTWVPLWRCPP